MNNKNGHLLNLFCVVSAKDKLILLQADELEPSLGPNAAVSTS